MEFTAQQIADFIQGVVEGNPSERVNNFSKIEEGQPGTLSFYRTQNTISTYTTVMQV